MKASNLLRPVPGDRHQSPGHRKSKLWVGQEQALATDQCRASLLVRQLCYSRERKYYPFDDVNDFGCDVKLKGKDREVLARSLSWLLVEAVVTGDLSSRRAQMSGLAMHVGALPGFPFSDVGAGELAPDPARTRLYLTDLRFCLSLWRLPCCLPIGKRVHVRLPFVPLGQASVRDDSCAQIATYKGDVQ